MDATRFELKTIYENLPNVEKNKWAINSGYKGYQGLYRYLRHNEKELAFHRIVEGLEKTIGTERFKLFFAQKLNEEGSSQVEIIEDKTNESATDISELKEKILDAISNSNDVKELQSIEAALDTLKDTIKYQRERLEFLSNLQKNKIKVIK
ncbi:hypothetical protein [Inconstantimicrobium mannanitabidum]|uniref:Uncharacterized protein n=1 Tax=Inconstantimicrobium mannanitabidum TaxID=1604901 RepID=A0ACB5RIP1_9CLOT|nr:hypothetical protein [Clostridium sp. TW13]GKX69001.1 hypothetical protein rsdtw13_42590 [Clostridium sp. TW13]